MFCCVLLRVVVLINRTRRIAGVVTVEVEGRKWMRILSSSEQKLLQLNELSEEEKAKMAEHKKHRATETKTTDSVFQSAEGMPSDLSSPN